jgi:hypothetical protein
MACSTVLAAGNPGNAMVLISKVKELLPVDGITLMARSPGVVMSESQVGSKSVPVESRRREAVRSLPAGYRQRGKRGTRLAHRPAGESQARVSIGLVREAPTSFRRPETGQHPRQRPAGTRDSVAPDVLRSPVPGDIVPEIGTFAGACDSGPGLPAATHRTPVASRGRRRGGGAGGARGNSGILGSVAPLRGSTRDQAGSDCAG